MVTADLPEAGDYTVHLEQVFQGPMDLLLHLVREQEVDIHDVEIHRVVDGYLGYLEKLREIDIELAGEFVVMAATLVAIKARSLLPREEVDLEQELDPRDELIQRLIEYRRFKEVSRDLSDLFEERRELFPRGDVRGLLEEHLAGEDEEPEVDLGELTAWDLLSYYSRLMRETLQHKKLTIATDARPMRYYVDQLVRWVRSRDELRLRDLLAEADGGDDGHRTQVVGTFCALLELMRLGLVTARQPERGADITIRLRPEHSDDVEEIVNQSGFADELADLDDSLAPTREGQEREAHEDGDGSSASDPRESLPTGRDPTG